MSEGKPLYPEDPYAPYQRCKNPTCDRVVRVSVDYCCVPCESAHTGGYEIHESGSLGHSDMCWVRHEARWHEGYRVKE